MRRIHDHDYAWHTLRRTGFRFHRETSTRPVWGRNVRRKLSHASVRAMRSWAAQEGWGRTRQAQALALQQVWPDVRVATIIAVLGNDTWHDPTYIPGAPDPAFWMGASLTRLTFQVMRS